jgi:hypothetical protein
LLATPTDISVTRLGKIWEDSLLFEGISNFWNSSQKALFWAIFLLFLNIKEQFQSKFHSRYFKVSKEV